MLVIDASLHGLNDGGDIDASSSNELGTLTQQGVNNEVPCHHSGASYPCLREPAPFYNPQSSITVNYCRPAVHYLMLLLGLLLLIVISFPRLTLLGIRPKILLISALAGLAILTLDCNHMPITGPSPSCCSGVRLVSYTYADGVLAGTISVSLAVIYSQKPTLKQKRTGLGCYKHTSCFRFLCRRLTLG